MPIQCPYCRNSLSLKEMKPGRFAPRCPKCQKKFALTVPEGPAGTPVVAPIRSEQDRPEATVAAATGVGTETGARDQGTAPPATPPVPKTVAGMAETGANLTGGWSPDATAVPPSSRAPTKPAPAPTATGAPGGTAETGGFSMATGIHDPSGAPLADKTVIDELPEGAPATLGGYQILKQLGRGGMGAVYLARQLSLQRNVALKVMRPEWASNPVFVSRFTREAYAAAQLTHHNVVQIYDFGEDKGTNYFSMEFVPGQSLAEVIKERKRLDPEVAVGYVLQAARGLKSAHDQSMIHRDIKPDNLMLNTQGVVKVADLGLVKTPAYAEVEAAMEAGVATVSRPAPRGVATDTGPITMVNAAMGTPAYMAPEQGRDATSVDGRADIYSLGCTLYVLITGRPPFEGKTAMELITKHQTEPIVPPEMIVKRVPKVLSEIILKMTAKRPEDRYANLAEVIKALEEYLGLPTAGAFSPREEHANILTEAVDTYQAAPSARLRRQVLLGVTGGCALLVALCALARQPILAGGFLGLGLMLGLAYFIIGGTRRKLILFLKTREFLLGGGLVDWLMIAAVLGLFVTVLFVFHLFWAWLAFGVLAVLAASYLQASFDKKVDAERQESLEKTRAMLRGLRLGGLDEETLRQFVAKYGGERWEEFFEELFGYEAKLDARAKWGRGERGLPRPKHAPWREGIINWIDEKQQARRAGRDRTRFQKIEEKSLEAQGVNLVTARRKAQRAAEAMVAMAAEWKAAAKQPAAGRETPLTPIGKALRDAALRPEDVLTERETGLYGRRSEGAVGRIVGTKVRFLAGALLMTGFLFWARQNEVFTSEGYEKAKEAVATAIKNQDVEALRNVKDAVNFDKPTKELKVNVPKNMSPKAAKVFKLFNGYNPGVAGLILLAASLFPGVRVGVLAFAGAAVAFVGPVLGLPALGPLSPDLASMAIGAALGVVGIVFGRSRR